ncbi:MAG: LysR family transcriptional regulator [Paenibacillaceae bacterium]|nr:LysR family transcriptional regulator [Paenibacillaceae bacterium]
MQNIVKTALTGRGSKLLEEAQQILASIDQSYQEAQAIRQNSVRIVQVGLSTDGRILRMESLIRDLPSNQPEIELQFAATRSEDIVQDLAKGRIDAGFYFGNATNPRIHSLKLQSIPVVAVYPDSWGIPEDEIKLEDFVDKTWIWSTAKCPFYKQWMKHFRSKKLLPQGVMHVGDESLIGHTVVHEMGCSLLPEPLAMQLVKDNKLRMWSGIDLRMDLFFGYPLDKKNDTVIHKIASVLNEIWKGPSQIGSNQMQPDNLFFSKTAFM